MTGEQTDRQAGRQDVEQANRQGSKTATRQTAFLLGIHELPLQKATERRQAESDGAYDSVQTLCLCKYVRSLQ